MESSATRLGFSFENVFQGAPFWNLPTAKYRTNSTPEKKLSMTTQDFKPAYPVANLNKSTTMATTHPAESKPASSSPYGGGRITEEEISLSKEGIIGKYRHDIGLDDKDLVLISTKELNKRLAKFGMSKERAKVIKQEKRTLKNRGYASNCRVKREMEENRLKDEVAKLRSEIGKYPSTEVSMEMTKIIQNRFSELGSRHQDDQDPHLDDEDDKEIMLMAKILLNDNVSFATTIRNLPVFPTATTHTVTSAVFAGAAALSGLQRAAGAFQVTNRQEWRGDAFPAAQPVFPIPMGRAAAIGMFSSGFPDIIWGGQKPDKWARGYDNLSFGQLSLPSQNM